MKLLQFAYRVVRFVVEVIKQGLYKALIQAWKDSAA
jgi:hypothetical protein